MPSKDYLMLRSARRAHLEARTALMQRSFPGVDQLPDSFLRRDYKENEALSAELCQIVCEALHSPAAKPS
jgi:hypothetical protein